MLCITNAEAERRALYLEFLKDGRADGAILMEPARDDPHVTGMARHYHLVQCSEYCDNQAVSHVSVDNPAAAREVVLTPGRANRRIGFIGADNDFMSTIARRQGYLDGLRVLEDPPREDDQTFAGRDYSFASGVEAARRLLAWPERPTALFCISDVLALGAVQAARELGLRVPEDLSVVGLDDVEYAVMGHPRLTTVRQPCSMSWAGRQGSFCSPRFRAGPVDGRSISPTPSLSGILRHGVPLDHKGNGSQYLRRKQA
ncbi:MAG: substrate-binding domain-containing protein [Oscillospiraceae bacterium]